MFITIFATALTFASSSVELLNQADVLREKGESLKAINLYNQAIVEAVDQNNDEALMGALAGRLIAWKHLFYKNHNKTYAILVKNGVEALRDIAKEKGAKNLPLIHYQLASADNLLGNYEAAEKELRLAVDSYPYEDAQKGDWIAHLGEALYLNGNKKEGKEMTLKGIEFIRSHSEGVDPFLIHVWTSGAYLKLAKLLKQDDPTASKIYLDEAKKIIASDSRLVIRKQQLDQFESSIP